MVGSVGAKASNGCATRQICMSGSMSGVWKRRQGRTSEAPPDERGGNRYVRPTATAPHSDSTQLSRSGPVSRTAGDDPVMDGHLPNVNLGSIFSVAHPCAERP